MTLQQTKDTKHLSNTLRRLGAPILTILFAMLLTVVAWGQTLDKGTYTISNNVSHDNPVGQGMARSYTEEISDVEVNDSGTFVTLGFNNTQYMGDFTVSVGGSKVTYETTTHANNVKKIKFKVPSLSSSIKVGLYVAPMDTTVEYTLTLNEGSLKLIKKAEAQAPQNSTDNSVSNSTTNSNSNATTNSTGNSTAATNNAASNNTSTNTSANANNATSGTTNSNSGNKTNTTTNNTANSTSGSAASNGNKTEAVEKAPASSEAVKKADTETAQKAEASVQKETEKVEAAKETEAEGVVEDNIEEVNKENTQEDIQVEETLEGQDEEQSEIEEISSETETADESIETETAANSSPMKMIILILGGIVVVGIIGFVIYSKRK